MSIAGINGYNYSNYYTGTKRNTAKANGMNSIRLFASRRFIAPEMIHATDESIVASLIEVLTEILIQATGTLRFWSPSRMAVSVSELIQRRSKGFLQPRYAYQIIGTP